MNEISNELIIVLFGALSGAAVTHIFNNSKLKKEQRIRFQNLIGDQISASLLNIRELVIEASVIERYDIAREGIDENTNAFDGTIYPAIMTDIDSIKDYYGKINRFREAHEKNLDCDTALSLWYGSRYFMQLILFIANEDLIDKVPEVGTFAIVDIQRWHKEFDKLIIKRINTPLNKLEFHQGLKWKYKRKKFEKMYKKSILNKLIEDEQSEEVDLIKLFLNQLRN